VKLFAKGGKRGKNNKEEEEERADFELRAKKKRTSKRAKFKKVSAVGQAVVKRGGRDIR